MKKEKVEFGVYSKYFSVYKAFKEEAEKLGVTYVKSFSFFKEEGMINHDCLWLTTSFRDLLGEAGMAFSNSPDNKINLDSNFEGAMEALRSFANQYVVTKLTKEQIEERLGYKIEIVK